MKDVCTYSSLLGDRSCEEQPPALAPSLLPSIPYPGAKAGRAAPAHSHVVVQGAPRVKGSASAKRPHSTTAALAGSSPLCMTLSVPLPSITVPCSFALPFLLFSSFFFLDKLITNTELKPLPCPGGSQPRCMAGERAMADSPGKALAGMCLVGFVFFHPDPLLHFLNNVC